MSFIRNALEKLPSSSSDRTQKSQNVVSFGELLVDLIWSVDGELDEILTDAKAVSGQSNADNTDKSSSEHTESLTRAQKAKEVADGDKETLTGFLRMLLIRVFLATSQFIIDL